MKKILLINPHETEQLGFTNPPLGLLYLAGTLLQHGFEVRILDACLEGKASITKTLSEFNPDMAGITALTPGRMKALETAQLVKAYNNNIKVVLGGAHPTIQYQQMMENYPFIDYIVLGEGENTCLELAQEKPLSEIDGLVYRDGSSVIKTKNRKYVENLDDIPFPAWHLIDLGRYSARGEGVFNGVDLAKETRVSVIFSRGCSGHCDFCSSWWIWRGWRHRSAINMADELELLYSKYGIRHFCFADDAMTIDRTASIELCDEIVKRKLPIAFYATTRTDCIDELLARKLKEAGCYEISFGIETGSQILLEKMSKSNDIQNSEHAIRICKDAGLTVTALLIVGSLGETAQTVQETVDFLKRTRPDKASCVGGLWILPGTKLYKHCQEIRFIDDSFWLTPEPYKVYTREYSLKQLKQMEIKIINYDKTILQIRIADIKSIIYKVLYYFKVDVLYRQLRELSR